MHILVFDTDVWVNIDYLKYLEQQGHTLIKANQEHQAIHIQGIIVYRTVVDEKLLDQYPNLTHVMRVGVGLDKVDVEECQKRGIKVINTPGANAESVADLAIRGTLSCQRHAIQAYETVKNDRELERFPHLGHELQSRTVGFIGFGNIGKKIYQRLVGFGVQDFLAYDPFLQQSPFDDVILVDQSQKVREKADIIYIVLPLTPNTRGLLDEGFFRECQDDVSIINTSRGAITNEEDLYIFLQDHPQASYYGDVWNQEPSITNRVQKLISLDNCIFTPHIGAHTIQAQKNMYNFALD